MRPRIIGLHHDHIDGSRAVLDVIEDLYRVAGRPFPFPSLEAWLAFFKNPQEDIIGRFATVTGVLQSREALDALGFAYGRRRAGEGYRYLEAKFAPQYHRGDGLSLFDASEAMIGGLRRAERQFGVRILPVICIGREADPDLGIEIARLALEYDGEAALDLACDEAGHPPEKHAPAYRLTFGSNVRRDCHAGEWVARQPSESYRRRLLDNVRTAVFDLRCHGVGHAIPLTDDPELVDYMVDHGIRVAGCPLSNLSSGLIGDVRELRIGELLDRGLIYTLNADDDLFLPPMWSVIYSCDEAFAFTPEQCAKLEANVFRGAFAADVVP